LVTASLFARSEVQQLVQALLFDVGDQRRRAERALALARLRDQHVAVVRLLALQPPRRGALDALGESPVGLHLRHGPVSYSSDAACDSTASSAPSAARFVGAGFGRVPDGARNMIIVRPSCRGGDSTLAKSFSSSVS